jgi:hypothetical protein
MKLQFFCRSCIFFVFCFILFGCEKKQTSHSLQSNDDEVLGPNITSNYVCKEVMVEVTKIVATIIPYGFAIIKVIEPQTVCSFLDPERPTGGGTPSSSTISGPGNIFDSYPWEVDKKTEYKVDPSAVIVDANDYLKCFDENIPATITVFVKHPNCLFYNFFGYDYSSNSRDIGESFISITQGGVTRVFGYYPQNDVTPSIDPNSTGIYVDKSNAMFSVSLIFNVNAVLFKNILNYVKFMPTLRPNYNFINNNNVGFAVEIMQLGNLQIEDPYVRWPTQNTIPSLGYIRSAYILGNNILATELPGTILTEGGVSENSYGVCP